MYDLFYLTSSTLALLSNLVSQDVLIRLIRFVSRFTVHWYNAIYFSTTFNTPYKRFTKFFAFCVLDINKVKIAIESNTSQDTRHPVY